jgi:hypothetical protein
LGRSGTAGATTREQIVRHLDRVERYTNGVAVATGPLTCADAHLTAS